MDKSANISPCGKYRYSLSRTWDESKAKVLFIGLNPSKADATKDDPTIWKLIKYCQSWGYGGFTIVNLFAYRSTNPDALLNKPLPLVLGPDNKTHLSVHIAEATLVVVMWGNNAYRISPNYTEEWVNKLRKMEKAKCFKINRDGSPAHPLYLPGKIKPIKFE